MDDVKEFFEHETANFWIAVVVVVVIYFIPILFGKENRMLI